ncbi:TraM recognition domain-containing protein [Paenibacillus larvae]
MRFSDNKESLFISFDGLIYDKFLKIVSRFIVLDINYLVSHRNRHKMKDQPMLAILDELSAYINDKVVDTINKSRSAGLHCVLATQTFADLQKIDASLLDQVIGNTNTHIFGQTNDPSGIEYMANTLGTYKDIDLTIQTERQEGRLDRQDLKGDKGTTRQVQKYKVAPDDIRDLRQGSFVIHRKAAGDKIQPAIIYARNPLID